MTATEFAIWLRGHLAAHPRLQRWLDDLDSSNAGLSDTVLARWLQRLASIPLQAAIEASEQLARGENASRFDRHPDLIAQIAGRHRPPPARVVAGQNAYRCPRCCDTGLVSIAVLVRDDGARITDCDVIAEHIQRHWQAYGVLDRRSVTSAAVRCPCPEGERFIKHPPVTERHWRFDDLIFGGVGA